MSEKQEDVEEGVEELLAEEDALRPAPLADTLALGAGAASGGGAAQGDPRLHGKTIDYLDAQTRLLGVQLEHRHEQRTLQLEHLRVRRIRERLQISLQVLLWALASLMIVALLRLVVWARNDDALIIEPLRAPASLVQRGMDGTVLATQLLDRLKTLQRQTDSARAPSTFKNSGDEEIKVEIPETGVSVGEVVKLVRAWLSRETHVSGEIYGPPTGGLAISVRAGDEPGRTFTGADADLDGLLDKAAEAVFAQTQPYLYASYLNQHGRAEESLKAIRELAISGDFQDRPWAYAFWSKLLIARGDARGAALRARQALALDPTLVIGYLNLSVAEFDLGHEEAALAARQSEYRLVRAGTPHDITPAAADTLRASARAAIFEQTGALRDAVVLTQQQQDLPEYADNVAEASLFMAEDLAWNHDVSGARRVLAGSGRPDDAAVAAYLAPLGAQATPYYAAFAGLDDWAAAAADLAAADSAEARLGPAMTIHRQVLLWPALAYALARSGRSAEAEMLLTQTPSDCTPCLRARARVAALQGRWPEAEALFAQAAAAAPSIPQSYTTWGEALLAHGDVQGALRELDRAVRRGPRDAEARELWGEALLRAGRAGAAAKAFEEAAPLAPRWGRLRLMWGEALANAGDPDGARRRYGEAASLDLSTVDKVALAHLR